MPILDNEEEVQKPKQSTSDEFLTVQNKDIVTIKSKVYHLRSHWLEGKKTSASCAGEGCAFCKKGLNFRNEYHYFVSIERKDEKGAPVTLEGFARIPASSFFDMNEISKAMGKTKRDMKWLILKSGKDKETRYTTSPMGEVEPLPDDVLEDNTQRLSRVKVAYEQKLIDKYNELTQVEKPVVTKPEKEVEPVDEPNGTEDVDPSDIPF